MTKITKKEKLLIQNIIWGNHIHEKKHTPVEPNTIGTYLKFNHKELFLKLPKENRAKFYFDIAYDIDKKQCMNCENEAVFKGINKGYGISCGKSCQLKILHKEQNENGWAFNSEKSIEKLKRNNLKKYGYEYPFQSKEIQKKIETNYIEKYGVNRPCKRPEIQEKLEDTWLKKYGGVWNASPEIRNKTIDTLNRKYGGIGLASNIIKEKAKETCLSRYGETSHMKTDKYRKLFSDISSISMAKRQQGNGLGYGSSGYVYFLHFYELNKVKIGISNNLYRRIMELQKEFGKCKILDVYYKNDVFTEEKRMHKMFDEYRSIEEKGCGKTEFFNDIIINELKEQR